MTKTLMALVDGSAYSESVCHHAAWVAGRTGAQVKLYHVLDPRRARHKRDLSGSIRLGARSDLLEKLSALDEEQARLAQVQGRAILEDAEAIVREAGVTEVVTRLRSGDIVETVNAKENAADMIMLGKRGEAAGLDSPHLGSNFERIVRASHKPVFVANRSFQPMRRALIAFDGRPAALKAVDYVARDPLFEGMEIGLATAGARTTAGDRASEGACATLAAGGHEAKVHLGDGQPSEVLHDLMGEGGYDFLVMGAYGHSRIRSFVIGSTTSEMIRTCRVPVVLMR